MLSVVIGSKMSTPRYTYTSVNGVRFLTRETWYLNGRLHLIDGPAWRVWEVVDGQKILTRERWYLNGRLHRIDEPAWRAWQVVGGQVVLTQERWYLNVQLHRTDGPAYRAWRVADGHGHGHENETVLTREDWYLKGTKIHPRILRQPVRAIERWWLFQRQRRQQAIESLLWDSGMVVFPGLMGLIT
jgi:hypothetical protein